MFFVCAIKEPMIHWKIDKIEMSKLCYEQKISKSV